MIPSAVAYVRAKDVPDALRLLAEGAADTKFLAGGQSLIPMMKLRLVNPTRLIDLAAIAPLRTIDVGTTRVIIGPLVTHARVADDPRIALAAPALSDAAAVIGDPQIRNFGTIGGSAVHSDPGADYPAALLALNATFTLTACSGTRDVAADDFFLGMYESALDPTRELLTAIALERAPASAYVKLEHPASGYAIAGAAVSLVRRGDTIASARIAITGVGDIAFRATRVEHAIAGVRVTDERAIVAACAAAAGDIDAQGDTLTPPDYRLAMADVVVERAVRRALQRGDL